MVAKVKFSGSSTLRGETSSASTTRSSSSTPWQLPQPARWARRRARSAGASVPSRYSSKRSSHELQFTQASERAERPRRALSLGLDLALAQLVRQGQLAAVDQRLDVAQREPHGGGDRLV